MSEPGRFVLPPVPLVPAGIAVAGLVALSAAAFLLLSGSGGDAPAPAAAAVSAELAGGTSEERQGGELSGSWLVHYPDRGVGAVTGRAIVSEDETEVTVRLVHPVTGERHTLRSTSVERTQDRLRVTLEGNSPTAPPAVMQPMPGEVLRVGQDHPLDRLGPQSVTLTLGEGRADVALVEPDEPPLATVVLDLSIADGGLAGEWEQRVHPETGRDGSGRGRLGEFAYLDDDSGLAVQRGPERWNRPQPVIHMAVVHADQHALLTSGNPRFPYPWSGDGSRVIFPDTETRYLLVIGEDLPVEVGEPVQLESASGEISYTVHAKPYRFDDNPALRPLLDSAWGQIESSLRQQVLASSPSGTITAADAARLNVLLAELRQMDFIMLRADLAPGALPGPHDFTLNGASGSWVLRYGNLTGQFAFARPLPGGGDMTGLSEPVSFAFAPDKLYLEVRTIADVPVDTLDLQIWVNGQPHLFDGWRTIIAAQLPLTDEDHEELAMRREAARQAGIDPQTVRPVRTYRSPPIALVPAGATGEDAGTIPGVEPEYVIPVNTGDVIRGVLASPDVYRVTPAFAEARVAASPGEITFWTLGPDADSALGWTAAVATAMRCAGLEFETPVDFDASARRVARTFTNTVILQGERRRLDMRVGDHAAMLVLRDTFIEMMTAQERTLSAISSQAAIASFRAEVGPAIAADPLHPLGGLEVNGPDGSRLDFSFTFGDDAFLKSRFGLDTAGLEGWRDRATRQALTIYIAETRRALELARAIAPCGDERRLVELAGRGFGGVYQYALGRLVTFESTALAPGDYAKPDRAARAWLLGVPVFAEALASQQAYSSTDTKAIITATATATGVVGIAGGLISVGAGLLGGVEAGGAIGAFAYSAAVLSQTGTALALGTDAVALSTSIYEQGSNVLTAQGETRFARAAALSIGTTRLEEAIENEPGFAEVFMELYQQSVSAMVSNFDIASTFGVLRRFGTSSRYVNHTGELIAAGRRPEAQIAAVSRGRALLGEGAAEARIAGAPRPAGLADAPAIDARTFDAAYPDGQRLASLLNVQAPSLRDPANPSRILDPTDVAPDPGVFGGRGGDTVAEATSSVPASSAPTPEPPRTVAEFRVRNQEAVDAYYAAQAEAQSVFAAGGELTPGQIARLESDVSHYMAQSLLSEAAREAQRAGLSFAEIEQVLAGRTDIFNPVTARLALVRDLEYAAVQRLGYVVVPEPDAVELLGYITRALNEGPDAVALSGMDMVRLRQWVDTYTRSGFDFFDTLGRMGTFSDFVETAARTNPGAGFEALTDATGIDALRRAMQRHGLVGREVEQVITNARAGQPAVVTGLASARARPSAEALDLVATVAAARRTASQLGEAALDRTERAALALSREALAEAGAAGTRPSWARSLDENTFTFLRRLSGREDVRRFAQSHPALMSEAAASEAGRAALLRQPYETIEQLAEEIARETRRIRHPVPGFYEQVAPGRPGPANLHIPEPRRYNNHDIIPEWPDRPTVVVVGQVNGRDVATFQRALVTLEDGGRELVMEAAFGRTAPRYVTGLDVHALPDLGRTPMATYMNVRAMQELGIGLGDPSLVRVRMSEVYNANTALELAWMNRVYGVEATADFLRHTHSVRYAESALNQAGYRIANVRITAATSRETARQAIEGSFFHSNLSGEAFLRQYGIQPDDVIESGWDIIIDIVPITF